MKKTLIALTLISALFAPLVVGVAFVEASPKTIVVPNDYLTIQEAIDNANTGDTVWVNSGDYHQNVTITKQVSLVGENSETTIIYGFRSYNILAPDITIQINSNDVTVSGLTLTNCSIGISANGNGIRLLSNVIECYPTGIHFIGSNGTIANNTVTSSQQGDITIIGSNNIIQENTITNGSLKLEGSFNSIDMNSAERINLEKSNSNAISRNYCTHLFLTENCSQNNVFRNVFDGKGRQGYGAVLIWGSDNVFSENIFSNDAYGASLGHSYFNSTGNRFYHNMFINNSEGHVNFNGDSNWSDNFWDNGVEGNYYDDYTGIDNNRDGIGDSPYTVQETVWDEELQRDVTVVFFQDDYPLMAPYDIENNRVVVPPPEPFPTLLVVAVTVSIVAVVVVGLLVHFKKRKR